MRTNNLQNDIIEGVYCTLQTNQASYSFYVYHAKQNLSHWGNLLTLNLLRPRHNGRFLADDTFKRIFLNENIRISTTNSLKFVPKGLINNIPALVLIVAWRWPGDKPLSEPMLVRSLTHICVTRPQWVKWHSAEIPSMPEPFVNMANWGSSGIYNQCSAQVLEKWG